MTLIKRFPLHPFVIGIYPVLALLAHNLGELQPSITFRSLVFSLLFTLLLYVTLRIILRAWDRAAVASSVLLAFLFSYGHLYNAVKYAQIGGFVVGRMAVIGPLWLAALGASLWWVVKKLHSFETINLALNLAALAAVIFPVAQIVQHQARALSAASPAAALSADSPALRLPSGQKPPDIYYFILDTYTRDDILLDKFDYDNRAFLEALSQRGFYVGRCSQSNHDSTNLSLASSLNFNYLDQAAPDYPHSGVEVLYALIKDSAVRRELEKLGYLTVAFETTYQPTELDDADVYYRVPTRGSLNQLLTLGGLNNFEVMYIRTTAIRLVSDAALATGLASGWVQQFDYPFWWHRETELYILNQFAPEGVFSVPSPKFVFTHILIPHPPYMFGPDGEIIYRAENDPAGYRDGVIFINQQITRLVDEILKVSETPPIIIIQGDHGPNMLSDEWRMAILNAYYLPGDGAARLYPGVSPVNTFRLIFNTYFGGDLPLLVDEARIDYRGPTTYNLVTDPRPGCETP